MARICRRICFAYNSCYDPNLYSFYIQRHSFLSLKQRYGS